MIIKDYKLQAEYFTDKEGNLYSENKLVKKIRKIIPDTELYQVVSYNGSIGIQTEYEIAWFSEKNIDGLDENKMLNLEKRCLDRLNLLQSLYPNIIFYLSRTKDNINGALIIHAFMASDFNFQMFNIIYDFASNPELYSNL